VEIKTVLAKVETKTAPAKVEIRAALPRVPAIKVETTLAQEKEATAAPAKDSLSLFCEID
jgi:hypothetical protein